MVAPDALIRIPGTLKRGAVYRRIVRVHTAGYRRQPFAGWRDLMRWGPVLLAGGMRGVCKQAQDPLSREKHMGLHGLHL